MVIFVYFKQFSFSHSSIVHIILCYLILFNWLNLIFLNIIYLYFKYDECLIYIFVLYNLNIKNKSIQCIYLKIV